MRVWALLKAAAITLGVIGFCTAISASCSLMSEPSDAAVVLGVMGTLGSWVGLAILASLAYRLVDAELKQLRPKNEDAEPKWEDDGQV
jgi:hypothetical protein